MNNKRFFCLIFFLCSCFYLSKSNGFNPIEIRSIQAKIAKIPSEYSIFIDFTPHASFDKHWAFGFYMPRTFNTLVTQIPAQNINPNLTMHVCRADNEMECQPLELIIKDSDSTNSFVLPSYYSAGFTNVFKVKSHCTDFPLHEGVTYRIALLNSNQGLPANLSSMPQNLFFIDDYGNNEKSVLYNIDVSSDKFFMDGYDQKVIDQKIAKHEKDKLLHSIPLKETDPHDQYQLIPSPARMNLGKTVTTKIDQLTVNISPGFSKDTTKKIEIFKHLLSKTGSTLAVTFDSIDKATVSIQFVDTSKVMKNPEGYNLRISNNKVTIEANTSTGVLYGLISFSQLIQSQLRQSSEPLGLLFPTVEITDYPRFTYRGIMLDVARHFFTTDEIKHLLDAMMAQKLNSLHLHFADDEAFRIQLPALSEQASKQASTRGYVSNSTNPPEMFGQNNLDKTNFRNDDPMTHPIPLIHYPQADMNYEGHYSISDIKALIAYANDRGITIIPEFEAPGHARALIHANPEAFNAEQGTFISIQGYYDDAMPVCLYNREDDVKSDNLFRLSLTMDTTSSPVNSSGRLDTMHYQLNISEQITTYKDSDTKYDKAKSARFTQKLDEIIGDVKTLFANQSTIYHIDEVSLAGDEVSKGAWHGINDCDTYEWNTQLQNAINTLSIKQSTGVSLALLRSQWFFKKVKENNPDFKMSGWQQTVQTDDIEGTILSDYVFPPEESGHIWVWNKSDSGGITQAANLAKHGYPTVLAFADKTYFDLTYTPDKWEPGFNWATAFSDTFAALHITHSATMAQQLSEDSSRNILGLEGALWSENLYTFKHLSYMALPKMLGLAEAAWSPSSTTLQGEKINWLSLKKRMGDGDSGFMGYLFNVSSMHYRGRR